MILLQIVKFFFKLTDNDFNLWDAMDLAAFEIMEKGFATGLDKVEYWSPLTIHEQQNYPKKTGKWVVGERPHIDFRRVSGMVHESSTTPMGTLPEDGNVVGMDFRPFGVSNVYVTGSGLWPTAASWNPTMTMCALSQKLADDRLETLKTKKEM